MGDPFSVAAGALSVVSVAIQVVEGLTKYYTSYKNQDHQIKGLVSRLEQVSSTLRALKDTLDRRMFRNDEADILRKTEESLFGSFELVRDLQQECQKLLGQDSPDKIQGAIRLAGRRITYPFRASTLQKLSEDIQALQDNLTLATNVLQLRDTRQLQEDLESARKLTETIRVSQISDEVRKWLKPRDVMVDQVAASSKRHGRTGSWFTDGKVFRAWLHATEQTPLVWISGFAGSGKSVLCSSAVQSTHHHIQSSEPGANTAVCFFYFTFNDETKQGVTAMLATIIFQLGAQSPKVKNAVEAFYQSNKAGILTTAMMFDLLRQSISLLDSAYVFLDAVDEVPRGQQRSEVLDTICRMQAWSNSPLRLFITSRDETDIRDSISRLYMVEVPMKNDAIDGDIDDYVNQCLTTNSQLRKLENHHDKIKQTLRSKAKGVFRWVECQLESIKRCPRSTKRLDECLNNLPPDLDMTYERILCSIGEESFRDALRLLKVLCFSTRPLTVSEVIDALAVDLTEPAHLDHDLRFADADSICEICPGLVQIAPADSFRRYEPAAHLTVRIAHFSVQEYLTCERIRYQKAHRFSLNAEEAHAELALVCVTYLLDSRLLSWPIHELRYSFLMSNDADCAPLTSYAATQWEKHYHHVLDEANPAHDAVSRLFLSHLDSFHVWVKLRHECRWGLQRYCPKDSTRLLLVSEPLWFAALLGFSTLVRKLLEQGSNVDADGGHDHTSPLSVASSMGRASIVQQLLDNGANPNLRSRTARTALLHACAFGNDQVARILINAGANVNQLSNTPEHMETFMAVDKCTPLQVASLQGHELVARMLIEVGADINLGGLDGHPALCLAARGGWQTIVTLLIENGADVDAAGLEMKTPLYEASESGRTDIVRILLQHHIDINAKCGPDDMYDPRRTETGGFSDTALHAASRNGCFETAEFLLDHGASVNAKNNMGLTPLDLAISDDWSDNLIDLLLRRGADIGSLDDTDFTAIVVFGGYNQLIKFLKLVSNLDPSNNHGRSIFHNKIVLENADLMWAVLEWHPDVEIPYELYPEALFLASRDGNRDLVQVLVKCGIERETFRQELGLALQAATRKGRIETAQLLIDSGADLALETLTYGTALQMAAVAGLQDLVRNLIEKGVQVDAQSIHGNALYLAAREGHLDIVRLLVTRGADIHANLVEYGIEKITQFYRERRPILQKNINNIANLLNPLTRTDCDRVPVIGEFADRMFYAILAEDYHSFVGEKPYTLCDSSIVASKARMMVREACDANGTAMQQAALNGHLEIVRFLIRQGADVNAMSTSFGTPLEAASGHGNVDMMSLLIANGANVNAIAQGSRMCALDHAKEQNHPAAEELLLRHGAKGALELQGKTPGTVLPLRNREEGAAPAAAAGGGVTV